MKPNRLLLACAALAAAVLPPTVALAQAPAAETPARDVRVPRCLVKLMDQVGLASDLTGIIDHMDLEEGDHVQAGQVVVKLRDDIAAAALATAEKQATDDTELKYSEKAAEVAQVEYEKTQQLRVKGATTDNDLRHAKLSAERAVLQIEKAQMQLAINQLTAEEKRAQLAAYSIKAPFDGIITRVYRRPGEAVRQGDHVLELVSTKRLRVEGYVDLKDAIRLRPGDRVEVTLDASALPLAEHVARNDQNQPVFDGRVVFIDVSVEPNTQQVRVWAEVTNHDDLLRAGVLATMHIFPKGDTRPLTAQMR